MISITQTAMLTCGKCGAETPISMDRSLISVKCSSCGLQIRYVAPRITALEVLSAFGLELGLDYDDQIVLHTDITDDEEVPEFVLQLVFFHQTQFLQELISKRRRTLSVYIGGSLHGTQHPHRRNCDCVHEKVAHAHWETYEFRGDERLWFVGKTTSEKKARQGKYESNEGMNHGADAES